MDNNIIPHLYNMRSVLFHIPHPLRCGFVVQNNFIISWGTEMQNNNVMCNWKGYVFNTLPIGFDPYTGVQIYTLSDSSNGPHLSWGKGHSRNLKLGELIISVYLNVRSTHAGVWITGGSYEQHGLEYLCMDGSGVPIPGTPAINMSGEIVAMYTNCGWLSEYSMRHAVRELTVKKTVPKYFASAELNYPLVNIENYEPWMGNRIKGRIKDCDTIITSIIQGDKRWSITQPYLHICRRLSPGVAIIKGRNKNGRFKCEIFI